CPSGQTGTQQREPHSGDKPPEAQDQSIAQVSGELFLHLNFEKSEMLLQQVDCIFTQMPDLRGQALGVRPYVLFAIHKLFSFPSATLSTHLIPGLTSCQYAGAPTRRIGRGVVNALCSAEVD